MPHEMSSVLIVEDEAIVAADLAETLSGMGYAPAGVAASADEALQCAAARCPDIVLVDIRIRGQRDGIETAALLREQFGVPVVYLTAHADEATIARAKETQPYGYLMKPVTAAGLRSAIEIGLHKHGLERRRSENERSVHERQEIADRVGALAALAARLAHEVNNPLTAVLANAAFVAGELGKVADRIPTQAPALIDATQEVVTAGERIAHLVAQLQELAGPGSPATGATDVANVARWAVRSTAPAYANRARVALHVDGCPPVALDATRLGKILVNLLSNAAEAIPSGSADRNLVTLTASRRGEEVMIEVHDSGTGMTPEVRRRIFEPFLTTKDASAARGLGLAICHGITSSAGGRIEAASEPGHGSTIRVWLPIATIRTTPDTTGAGRVFRKGRLLAVDDERMILKAYARILADHDLVTVTEGTEVLERLARGEHYDLILSDLMMPAMTGMDLYEQVLADHPEAAARFVFVSGGAATPRAEDFLAVVPNVRLMKPFTADTLRELVQQRLAALDPTASPAGE